MTVRSGGGARGAGSVTFGREDRPRYRLDAYGVVELACTHLTGHHDPDVIVTEWTGGGSCCEVIEVIQLYGGPHRVLRFEGKVLEVRGDLGTPSRQIAALLSVFRFFGGLCGACSPGLPVVYVYDGRRYVERSSRVPAPVIAYAARERKELAAPGPGDSQRRRGAALGILAAYTVLGREAEGWRIVSTAPSAVTGWLHQHEEEMRRVIGGVRD